MNVEDPFSSSTSATKYRTTASVSPDVSPASPAGVAPQPSAQLQLSQPRPQQQSKVVNPSKSPAPQPSVPAGASLRSPCLQQQLQPQPQLQQKPKVATPSGSRALQPSATHSDAVPTQSSLSSRPQSLPSGSPASQPSAPPNVMQSPQSLPSSRPQPLPSGSPQSSPSPHPQPRPEQQRNVVIPSVSPAKQSSAPRSAAAAPKSSPSSTPRRLPTESPAPQSSEPLQSRLSTRPKPLPSESSEPPQSRLSSRPKPLPSGWPPQPQPQQQTRIMIPSCEPNALCSGGGISFLTRNKNARFSYGYASFKGKRSSMEDFYEARISDVDGQMVGFFGVFDGHGGSRAAEYLKKNLFKNLSNHPDFIKDTKSAIVQSFRNTDDNYINEEKGQQKDAGSTASTAVLLGDRLFVANVGDSRVVACRAGSAVPLSTDHKPNRSDERQRIEEAGGYVIWAGTWRVGGVLAVSRAFGDKLLKPFVVAEPEIQEEEIDDVDFIIIASDGLWNVLSNKDAVAIITDIVDTEVASRKLVEESYAKGSSDNITCVVIRFENTY